MKAYLLARVSTDEQNDALPAQTRRLVSYAQQKKLDYELIEFTESAYNKNRDLFRAFVDKIRDLPEHCIIVFDKIDRYSRDSTSEEVRILRNLYKSGKIELHFPSDNLIIHKNSPATDKMRLGLGTILAEYYSDAIRDNVLRRIEQKLQAGEWIGVAPFGYKYITEPDGKRNIVRDGIKAEAMVYAFKEYAAGHSSLKLIRKDWIDKFGIKAPTSSIANRLNNHFYYGMMESHGILYAHKYEPLISKALFETAENVRNGVVSHRKRWAGLPFVYRGLITCAECGHRITFERHKGRYIYGRCTQFSGKHNAKYVNEEHLTEQLSKLFEAIKIPDEILPTITEELDRSYERVSTEKASYQNELSTSINKLENRLSKLQDEYFDGNVSKEIYAKKSIEYQQELHKLKNNQNAFELNGSDQKVDTIHLLNLANQAPKLFEVADQKQKQSLIETVLSNLELDGDQLRSKYKKPFDTMAFCNEISSWCPEVDSNHRP